MVPIKQIDKLLMRPMLTGIKEDVHLFVFHLGVIPATSWQQPVLMRGRTLVDKDNFSLPGYSGSVNVGELFKVQLHAYFNKNRKNCINFCTTKNTHAQTT